MKLGVFSVSLPEYTVAESVALLKELGYDAVEWRVDTTGTPAWFQGKEVPYSFRYWVNNKATLDVDNIMQTALEAKKCCDEAGIQILGLSTSLTYEQVDKVEEVFKAANAIGVRHVRAGIFSYDPAKSDKTYPEMFETLKEGNKSLLPLLKKYNVRLMIEVHHGTVNASPSSAYRMMEGLDPEYYGLIFDPGNMVFEGHEDYLKSIQLMGPYLAHVHVKNGIREYDGEDELGSAKWKQTWVPLNKGMADLGYLVKCLKQAGYQGALSVEDFSNDKPTREKLEDNIAYLKKLIAAAE